MVSPTGGKAVLNQTRTKSRVGLVTPGQTVILVGKPTGLMAAMSSPLPKKCESLPKREHKCRLVNCLTGWQTVGSQGGKDLNSVKEIKQLDFRASSMKYLLSGSSPITHPLWAMHRPPWATRGHFKG
jgi:hypothetical protein